MNENFLLLAIIIVVILIIVIFYTSFTTNKSFTISTSTTTSTSVISTSNSIANTTTRTTTTTAISPCSDGTEFGRCSINKPKFCDNGNLIDKCMECGCSNGYDCQTNGICSITPEINQKDMSKYTEKTTFIISDENWRDVLSLVPVSIWTNGDNSISKYPLLIYHEEDAPFLSIGGQISSEIYEGITPSIAIQNDDWQSFNYDGNFISKILVYSGYPNVTYHLQLQDSNGNIIANSQEITTNYNLQLCSFNFNIPVTSGEEYKLIWKINNDKTIWAVYSSNQYSYGEYSRNPNTDIITEVYDKSGLNKTFDADSIINLMQQYHPNRVIVIGDSPKELDNLLTMQPAFGAGIDTNEIQKISVNDYLSFWESIKNIVYVEDNYELSLLASTYASLIDAPLIVQGSSLNNPSIFFGKNIICVGSVNPTGNSCTEQYNLEQLQRKYLELTNTEKIILINPNDLYINVTEPFLPGKASYNIFELYSKISLAAPILASAKHEVIFSIQNIDYQDVDTSFKSKLNNYYNLSSINDLTDIYLTIMASSNAVPNRKYEPAAPDVGAWNSYRALDQTQYGDTDGDFLPDLSVGRIMGITLADVSSYLARDIFYDNLRKTNNMKFLATTTLCNQTELWSNNFTYAGYNSISKIGEEKDFISSDWVNQDLIYWQDHGGYDWAGISSKDIPLLNNSIIINDACLTCSPINVNDYYNGFSFCNRALRNGALAHLGALDFGSTSNAIYMDTMNGIYYNNMTLGKSFTNGYNNFLKKYQSKIGWWMTTLLGDPTIEINPPYLLKNPLEFGFC
ncbi:MAG: C25 family cysteine peptidase [Candidatus Aenigmarchaeota archaeon]|nr:C25 family cysteine peptidase [Candidatus Aenigmarchaeota archaeon]